MPNQATTEPHIAEDCCGSEPCILDQAPSLDEMGLPKCRDCGTPYPDLLSAPCRDGDFHDYR